MGETFADSPTGSFQILFFRVKSSSPQTFPLNITIIPLARPSPGGSETNPQLAVQMFRQQATTVCSSGETALTCHSAVFESNSNIRHKRAAPNTLTPTMIGEAAADSFTSSEHDHVFVRGVRGVFEQDRSINLPGERTLQSNLRCSVCRQQTFSIDEEVMMAMVMSLMMSLDSAGKSSGLEMKTIWR